MLPGINKRPVILAASKPLLASIYYFSWGGAVSQGVKWRSPGTFAPEQREASSYLRLDWVTCGAAFAFILKSTDCSRFVLRRTQVMVVGHFGAEFISYVNGAPPSPPPNPASFPQFAAANSEELGVKCVPSLNLVYTEEEGYCLLYTSPSPRD